MEFIAEFKPQILYQQMLILSIMTGLILVIAIIKLKNYE
jgi:hypothetical protein